MHHWSPLLFCHPLVLRRSMHYTYSKWLINQCRWCHFLRCFQLSAFISVSTGIGFCYLQLLISTSVMMTEYFMECNWNGIHFSSGLKLLSSYTWTLASSAHPSQDLPLFSLFSFTLCSSGWDSSALTLRSRLSHGDSLYCGRKVKEESHGHTVCIFIATKEYAHSPILNPP